MNKKTYQVRQKNGELQITDNEGKQISASQLLSKDKKVYAFRGEMGAGKTTLITQLCKDLGVQDTVNSPTFAIVNVYSDSQDNYIYHFDCYRLRDIQEALDMGAAEYIYSDNLCFIEWPEMIEAILPEDTVNIYISNKGDYRELVVED